MSKKEIIYGKEAKEKLLKGIEKLADAVKVTLGSKGRTVLISDNFNKTPHVTKDGATVARAIELEDFVEEQGALLIKSVANKTESQASDGTTTSTILARVMSTVGLDATNNDSTLNVFDIKRGMDTACDDVCKFIEKHTTKIKPNSKLVEEIATISANNDKTIGKVISTCVKKVGQYGVIKVEESKTTKTSIEITSGMSFDRGIISPYFITNRDKRQSQLDNPYILITDRRIEHVNELKDLFEKVHQTGRPLAIICDDMELPALSLLLDNHMKGLFRSVVIKAPEFGNKRHDILNDIAVITGGTFISKELGKSFKDLELEDLGQASSITSDLDNTVISGGNSNEDVLAKTVSDLKALVEIATSPADKNFTQSRIAKLVSGVATIRVGANSDVELNEKRYRYDDALGAVLGALEEGVIIGGGTILIEAQDYLNTLIGSNYSHMSKSFLKGYKDIVLNSLSAPFSQLIANAQITVYPKDIVNKNKGLRKIEFGINTNSGEIENLKKSGVLDPSKVAKSSLRNAVSVVGTLLTTECAIVSDPRTVSYTEQLSV